MLDVDAIAQQYNELPHTPGNPSYRAFCNEVVSQYKAMRHIPVHVELVPGTSTGNYGDMVDRLYSESTLSVAMDGSPFDINHPLRAYASNRMQINWMFRAIHDYFGHYLPDNTFETTEGEIAAYYEHRKMFSKEAQLALFSETIAQLAYHESTGIFVPVQKCVMYPNYQELL